MSVFVYTLLWIDPSHKSHNVPELCPTMHHFVTEMSTCVHISVTNWCIVGYLPDALWDLWNGSILESYWYIFEVAFSCWFCCFWPSVVWLNKPLWTWTWKNLNPDCFLTRLIIINVLIRCNQTYELLLQCILINTLCCTKTFLVATILKQVK